ncbi:kinase-like protein [Pilatotrama ljubarskyi]|nr:kinase-like protein [Pilatotrama ljubarskyi]
MERHSESPGDALPSWAQISSQSDEELYRAYEATTHIFPPASPLRPFEVGRIATDAVMKVGPFEESELLAMRLASERSTIPIPAVRLVFGDGGRKAVVMDYIPGKTLKECWSDLSLWQRMRVLWTIRGYIRQLRRIRSAEPVATATFPGPLGNEPQLCFGPMFTEYGAGPFHSYEEMAAWYMHKLDVNRRYAKYPPESEHLEFDSSVPLVLTHFDIHPNNIILGDDGRVWLIDWEFAGFYPQWFEYASMREGWDVLGKWKVWILGFVAGFYERQLYFISRIGWALNTGVLL